MLEEGALAFLSLVAHVIKEVLSGETRAANHKASDSWIDLLSISGEVLDERRNNRVIELLLLSGILLCSHRTTRLCQSFLDVLLEEGLGLCDDEDVSHAFLHRDSDHTTCLLVLDHLVKLTYMHRVEDRFDDHNLSRGLHVHGLLLIDSNVAVLFCVDSINAQTIILRVILE